MKVKLDLHTHIWEAPGFQSPNLDWAAKVVQQAKAMGIDGIAITEHHGIENSHWHIDKGKVLELAKLHGLLLTRVGDAHRLADIGTNYVEVDLEEFYSRGIFLGGRSPLP